MKIFQTWKFHLTSVDEGYTTSC